MADVTPVSLNCRICGGNIVNDYLAGTCICSHCGNSWSMEDMIPDYRKYTSLVVKINKAHGILDDDPNLADTEQAKIMFQSASAGCESLADGVASELMRLCREGENKAENLRSYIKGKMAFENKGYSAALEEFQKIPGFKDADDLAEQCKEQIEIERKKQLPWAIVTGVILPAILCIFLKEKLGFPIVADIFVFLACTAGLSYVVYRGGLPAVIIRVASIVCLVPLILFVILAYGFHMDIVPSLIISIGGPIVAGVVFSLLAEKKK